jgi:type IV secretory pathway VirB6-like protein
LRKLFSLIQSKYLKTTLGRSLLLLLLLFSYSSCSNEGCIEAENFGEYEQEVLTIQANAQSQSCEYISGKPVSDYSQGSGLTSCFTMGTVSVTDTSGTVYSNEDSKGCDGFDENSTAQRICIEECRIVCANNSSATSGGSEPYWTSTTRRIPGRNSGITISPESKIRIKAFGNIVLGGGILNNIFAFSTDNTQHSRELGFDNKFLDLTQGISKQVQFSGSWTDPTNSAIKYGGDVDIVSQRSDVVNGAKRLAAFITPHPLGYSFDKDASFEQLGTTGTPLFADDRLWACSYSGSVDKTQSSCNSLTYNTASGYPSTDNTIAQSYYAIDSRIKMNNLGSIGGMIRWELDGLTPFSSDPFASSGAVCSPTCSSLPGPTLGAIVGDISTAAISITNNETYAVKISFKSLLSTNACDLTSSSPLVATVKDSGNNILNNHNIETNNSGWSSNYISLESGDSITISSNDTNAGGTTNCGTVTAYRRDKIHDIKIDKSGFVSFTSIGQGSSAASFGGQSCVLKGRVINPLGDRISGVNNEFYEYESFSTSTSDPLRNLSIPVSSNPQKTWSSTIYVRRGQILRFDPSSWEGEWTATSGLNRRCGVGMAMKVGGYDFTNQIILDKPAFLCRGVAPENVDNPNCIIQFNSNGTKFCKEYSADCGYNAAFDSPYLDSAFCPIESCQSTYDADTCDQITPSVTSVTCSSCLSAQNRDTPTSTTIAVDVDQCYNLENYEGKVSKISAATGISDSDLADDSKYKGAVRLETFNGSYGNFSSFSKTGSKEGAAYNNNIIYQSRYPIMPEISGRASFLILKGDSFDNIVTSNSASYNGVNGYKVDLSGRQEFKNGQWLEAILCLEEDNTSVNCSSDTIPIQIGNQPNIVKIKNPTTTAQDPEIESYYKFDESGDLIRFNNSNSSAGINPNSALEFETFDGDKFYRHNHGSSSQWGSCNLDATSNITLSANTDCGGIGSNCGFIARSSNYIDDSSTSKLNQGLICADVTSCNGEFYCSSGDKLRISFKIKDPEIGNCAINAPNLVNSCSGTACDGVITDNDFFESAIVGNSGQICTTSIGSGSSDCKKQYYCANTYHNNSGSYQVIVQVENDNYKFSGIVDQVVSPVIEIMDGDPNSATEAGKIGQAERIYKQVTSDARFQAIIQISVILMITFYGVGYLMGVSEFSQGEIITRIIKIGIVYLFISPGGWEWFDALFVNFFKEGSNYLTFLMASSFDQSPELSSAIASGDYSDKAILFSSVDKVLGLIFSDPTLIKIQALLFASLFGPVYLYIVGMSILLYIYAVANAVLLYLTAQVFISILFILGPIFFIMLLFNQTKETFDKWLSELIGFSLQQVFLLTTLAFFNMMMYEVIKMSLGYRVCWDEVWVIDMGISRISLLSFWTLPSLPSSMGSQGEMGNIGNPEGIPSLFSILFIWIIASIMHSFVGFITDLAAAIGGSIRASQLSGGIKSAAEGTLKNAKGAIGGKLSGVTQSVDRALFNSGKKAEKSKKEAKEQYAKEDSQRKEMNKAGDKAVDKFKNSTAGIKQLSGAKTGADQKKILQGVKDNAKLGKGLSLGLSADGAKQIMTERSRLASATLSELGSNKIKSKYDSYMSPDKANSKITGSQLKESMKGASNEDRSNIGSAIKNKDLNVSVGLKDRMAHSLSKAPGAAYRGSKSVGSAVTDPMRVARGIQYGANRAISSPGNAFTSARSAPGKAWSAAKSVTKDHRNEGHSTPYNLANNTLNNTRRTMGSAINKGSYASKSLERARKSNVDKFVSDVTKPND